MQHEGRQRAEDECHLLADRPDGMVEGAGDIPPKRVSATHSSCLPDDLGSSREGGTVIVMCRERLAKRFPIPLPAHIYSVFFSLLAPQHLVSILAFVAKEHQEHEEDNLYEVEYRHHDTLMRDLLREIIVHVIVEEI